MSDEHTPDGAPDGEDSIPKSTFQGVVKQRDEIKSELRELKAWKAEREAADESARQEQLKHEKKFETLIGELQGKIKTLESERDSIATEWQTKWEQRDAAERSERFQSALADKFPGVNRTVLRALMREAAEGSGLDLAPEKLDSRTVDAAAAALKKSFPDVLTNRGNSAGGAPLLPGFNPQNKAPGEMEGLDAKRAAVREIAKRRNDARMGRSSG